MESTPSAILSADFFESQGWHVKRREYGTRVYAEMFTLYDIHDVPFVEIRRRPLSDKSKDGGLFDERACHIRLSNVYCYSDSPIDHLREFVNRYEYIVIRIFRIDICLDFIRFDKGDEPNKFIKRYIDGRYSKVNQTNISAHGVDRWDGRTWQTISWGKQKSMISTKFYCKTKEMQQVHDKPYIRHSWWLCGLIDNPITGEKRQDDGTIEKPDIWRVEFSIKSSAKKWYLIERADTRKDAVIPMPHTLDIYDTRKKLLFVFASLSRHYFHFKVFEEGVRKDRCKDKILFEFKDMDTFYKVDRLASHTPSTPRIARLINALTNLRENTIETETIKAIDTIIKTLKKQQLIEYSNREMTGEEILTLQRLIALRMKKASPADLDEQMQEVRNMVQDMFDSIF